MPARILALVPLLALSACATPALDVQPRYGEMEISGSAGVTTGGVGGNADLDQAGLDQEQIFSARADLQFGPHLVFLGQAPSFTGSGTLDVTLSDGTNTINAGTPVDSRIDFGAYDLALLFDLVPGDTVELALGFGAAYADVDMRFEDPASGTTIDEQANFPIPLACALASVWIGPLQVSAFAGGMEYTYEGDTVSYLDADVYARWKLFGGEELLRMSLVVGYRLTDLELEYADGSTNVESDLTIAGPYVGLEGSL